MDNGDDLNRSRHQTICDEEKKTCQIQPAELPVLHAGGLRKDPADSHSGIDNRDELVPKSRGLPFLLQTEREQIG